MITIVYPAPNGAERPYVTAEVPFVENKAIKHYLHELRIVAMRMRCRMVVDGRDSTLRLSYVPNDGETIRLLKAGRSMT